MVLVRRNILTCFIAKALLSDLSNSIAQEDYRTHFRGSCLKVTSLQKNIFTERCMPLLPSCGIRTSSEKKSHISEMTIAIDRK
jgi:hypothetical protein